MKQEKKNPRVEESGLEFSLGLAIRMILVVLLICFFFPICTVSCSSSEISGVESITSTEDATEIASSLASKVEISALDGAFGLEVWETPISGNPIFALLFLLPLAALVLSFIFRNVWQSAAAYLLTALFHAGLLWFLMYSITAWVTENLSIYGMGDVTYNFVLYMEWGIDAVLGILSLVLLLISLLPSLKKED